MVSLTLFPGTPLWQEAQEGLFAEATERERLTELHLLLRLLEIPVTIAGHTVSNTVPLLGRLPEQRSLLLHRIEEALAQCDESALAAYRRQLEHL